MGGIGSAHRAAVLSMFPSLIAPFDKIQQNEEKQNAASEKYKVQKLQNVVLEESCLTHYAPLSRHCSIAVNYLCRALIIGHSWQESMRICHKYVECEQIKEILMEFIENNGTITKQNNKMKLE